MIKENTAKIKETIRQAVSRVGRSESEITLIAVSKTKPIELLYEAYEIGLRDFGENKTKELCEKQEQMNPDASFHMIGHLQRNKVKTIVDKVKLIHSVDSYRLAEEIDKEAKKLLKNVDILIEVNIAGEDSKYGVVPEQTEALIREISNLTSVRVKGLMTVAPYTENPEENRPYFKKMHQLYVDINRKNIDNVDMKILSMGMTGDFFVAIEEGATMIRVGTGIFGERDYTR